MDILNYLSYKAFLSDLCSKSGYKVSDLAKMAGCNRSYFSQMLSGKVNLTPDHIINLSEEIGLSELEKEYLLTICLLERAALSKSRHILELKIERIKKKILNLSKKIKASESTIELSEENKVDYYSNWLMGQVHIMTSISEFQTPESIAQKLNLKTSSIKKILNKLTEMKLVTKKNNLYFHQSGNLHISQESGLIQINHFNWRMRALHHISDNEGIHYSSTFSVSKKDISKMKKHLLDFINDQRNLIGNSGSEEIYCFTCDFFESY